MKKVLAGIFLILQSLTLGVAGDSKNNNRLFKIERSKNANIVCYDACIDSEGKLVRANPVEVYWLLNEKDGKRKELTWLDKKAYGFKWLFEEEEGALLLTLVPYRERPIRVFCQGKTVYAVTEISGTKAVLTKIYIDSRETLTGPKIRYIELFGSGLNSENALYEKIIPD